MKYIATVNNEKYEIEIDDREGNSTIRLNGSVVPVDFIKLGEGMDYSLLIDHISCETVIDTNSDALHVDIEGELYTVAVQSERDLLIKGNSTPVLDPSRTKEICAPMPGLIVDIEVEKGDAVSAGSGLIIVEAMKMENELKASIDCKVKEIRVKKGDTVEKGQVLIVLA